MGCGGATITGENGDSKSMKHGIVGTGIYGSRAKVHSD